MERLRLNLSASQEKKKEKGLCINPFCQNKLAKRRNVCSKCRRRREKVTNLLGYTYDIIKQNAKRRGHEFTISREYFKKWCEDNNYLELKGKHAGSASIDRIISSKGYVEGNLQILTLANNTYKHNYERHGTIPDKYFSDEELKDLPF